MDVEYDDKNLERLFKEAKATAGFDPAIEKKFRKVVGLIRAAPDERTLAAFQGLRMEKLKGARAHQRSLRLNDQWRLIIEIRGEDPRKRIGVIGIEDYH